MVLRPRQNPGEARGGKRSAASRLLILILVLIPASATAQAPSVIVSNYTVTPPVLMPGDEGTITVVLGKLLRSIRIAA